MIADLGQRRLTDFEQVLLANIAVRPQSAYGLKKLFSESPASVYQPSPGALHPALRRLEQRGLLRVEEAVSKGRRRQRLYHVTEAGRAAHLDWLRQPVSPDSAAADLGLHVMRFAMMSELPRQDSLAFLESLADALGRFVAGIEQYLASGNVKQYLASGSITEQSHAELALRHGVAVHRASLEWARSAHAVLAGLPEEAAAQTPSASG